MNGLKKRRIRLMKGIIQVNEKEYPFTITRYDHTGKWKFIYMYNENNQPFAEIAIPMYAQKNSCFEMNDSHYKIIEMED